MGPVFLGSYSYREIAPRIIGISMRGLCGDRFPVYSFSCIMDSEPDTLAYAERIVELYKLLVEFRDGLVELSSISKCISDLRGEMDAQLKEEKLVRIGLRLLDRTNHELGV